MTKILHKDLSYKITGLFFKVQKELGRFCREKQFADKVEELLKVAKIQYNREFDLKNLKGNSPKGNRVDFFDRK